MNLNKASLSQSFKWNKKVKPDLVVFLFSQPQFVELQKKKIAWVSVFVAKLFFRKFAKIRQFTIEVKPTTSRHFKRTIGEKMNASRMSDFQLEN